MKKFFNTPITTSLMAMILLVVLFSFNALAAPKWTISLAEKAPIKKVVVTGNTRVTIVQSNVDMVKMDYLDMDKVSVKQMGNTLTVHSSERDPIVVFVYVRDIYRIVASGDANVSTSGKFAVKNLQVMLREQATARIKATTESLYTAISDQAQLKLLGNTDNHSYLMAGSAKIDTNKFAALQRVNMSTEEITASVQKKIK
jgi:hypothetical protein